MARDRDAHEKAAASRRRNFSETEFMDSGMGRSHTSDMPFLGLENEDDDDLADDSFTEQFLLNKLHGAQRRLTEIRNYKTALIQGAYSRAVGGAVGEATSPATSPHPLPPFDAPPRVGAGGKGGGDHRASRLFVASFRLPLKIQVGKCGDIKSSLTTGGLGLVSAFRDLLGRIPIRWLGVPGQVLHYAEHPRAPAATDSPDDTNVNATNNVNSLRMGSLASSAATHLTEEERINIAAHLSSTHPDSTTRSNSMSLLTYVPFFPDPDDATDHQEFCNSVLWQLFHYLPLSFEGERVYQPDMFEAYERVNVAYAEALIEEWHATGISEEDAMFWVHDIHLLLVPKLLRDRLPTARIGFFLHTPFPAGEVYRTLPPRKELLEGMLGADLIGFHTYDYARHFLGACERLLGLSIQPDRVDNGGVYVQIGVYPFGIDTDSFKNAMNKSSVGAMRDDLKESLAGKRVILGVDRLDFIKGIPNKLLAVEHLLEAYPEWRGRVVVLQVATPSQTSSEEYNRFRSEVLEMVGRINGRFGTLEDMPIHYREHTLTFEELCSLYSLADVAVLTSLRDGMNLVSYEYVMCQKQHHGALVLSEFTGAAQNLPGAILVNPWDIDEVGNAIHTALEMSDADREVKHNKMYSYVIQNTSAAWGVHFIDDVMKYAAGRVESMAKLVLLPTEKVFQIYRNSERRLLLLDYDGTLRKYESQPELADPSERLKELLTALAADPRNVVFIVTGRQKKTMMKWFDSTGLGFAVEHGFAVRWPDHLRDRFDREMHVPEMDYRESSGSSGRVSSGMRRQGVDTLGRSTSSSLSPPDSPSSRGLADGTACFDDTNICGSDESACGDDDGWQPLVRSSDLEQMRTTLNQAKILLRRIEGGTPASFISVKESALTWHFRDADPDFAFSAAQDARQALDDILMNSPMEVLMGGEAIHVRPRGVHKGAAALAVLSSLCAGGWEPDWILSIGDDKTDEEMFETVHESHDMVTTVTVGRKTTAAKYFVPAVDSVIDLLKICSELGSDLDREKLLLGRPIESL